MTGPDKSLPPIIKRASSPARHAVSSEALVSPRFHDPPSPNPALHPHAQPQPGSYFASHAGTPSPSGILLNKNERAAQRDLASRDRDGGGGGGRVSPAVGSNAGDAAAAGLLRVASPDGSASESGVSDAAGPSSTAPSSLVGSPPSHTLAKPGLAGLAIPPSTTSGAGEDPAAAAARRASSPPSPHCHFAPLPKVDGDRPATRRNSFANRVKPFVPKGDRPDGLLTPGSAFDHDDDDNLPSPPGAWQAGDSSIPTPSALSQRLNSSLTFTNTPSLSASGAGGISPVRPGSRRSSSSRRSRSPSPPGGGPARYRTPSGASGQSRSHSPNLSRHASTDALSLHYIEAGAALSRTSSRAGSEKGGPGPLGEGGEGGGEGVSAAAGSGVRRLTSSSTDRASSSSSSRTRVAPFIDRDKEADLHRLQEKAAHGNADAERAVSPALVAARERSASRGAAAGEEREREGRPHVIKRKGSNEEVVEVGPGEEKDAGDLGGELEEVEEEPEEEEEAEENGTDEDDGTDEDEGENERDREGEDEEDEEDEDEEAEMEERKTSKGAAVEVVRWHRPERDAEREAQPSPANVPHVSPPLTAGAPPAPPVPTPAAQ